MSIETRESGAFVKNYTILHVETGNTKISCQIDDDMRFALARLVKRDHWVLVLNDEYVVAGFDLNAGRAYGEYEWDKLPLLIWDDRGEVLAQRRMGASPSLPANYRPFPTR
ncbi:MAG: hypothetical protein SF069_00770 [Phycisphaerae bacterium]|nr:hypothetical protein [Phycisphaerae bacterium]